MIVRVGAYHVKSEPQISRDLPDCTDALREPVFYWRCKRRPGASFPIAIGTGCFKRGRVGVHRVQSDFSILNY